MRILVVEDEFLSRMVIQKILSQHGDCDIAVDGEEAIHAFKLAHEDGKPYDLICMDIMMPNINGQEALKKIRELEFGMEIKGANEVKIIMTTALGDAKTVVSSYKEGATSYIVKPISKDKLLEEVKKLGLLL
ncbi:MAG: response regulator [Deltaproteobacteria bacterium]|nr:response regulator [Deltaproteobacteria bacterium]